MNTSMASQSMRQSLCGHVPRVRSARVSLSLSLRSGVVMSMRKPSASDLKENFRPGPLDGIGGYLSEGFAQIFSGKSTTEVPWIEQPAFSGSIAHHEIGSRHGHSGSYGGSQHAHGRMTWQGGFDAKEASVEEHKSLGWVKDTVGRSFFGTNLNEEGQSGEPRKFYSTGYTGRVMSARRIRHEVDRLGRRH